MSTQPLTLVPKIWGEPLKPRREILWLQEGKKCHWCGRPTRLVEGDSGDQATIDHVIPRYKGGSNDINTSLVPVVTVTVAGTLRTCEVFQRDIY